MGSTALVMGASGFLGSHITRQLVARGDTVRAWTRPSSSRRAFADLDVEHVTGELDDAAALRQAMSGVDVVHYCIVDTRPALRDPAPLFETNVHALRQVLDAAVAADVPRFVFCSTVGTIGGARTGPGDEQSPHDWAHLGGAYIASRVQAEDLVLQYVREFELPAVVLCVGTTWGPYDHGPSAHGTMVQAAAHGKMPVYVKGAVLEMVGVEDAARAFLLAAERGRVGDRYIISERTMTFQQVLTVAAQAVGATPPRIGLPMGVMRVAGGLGDTAQKVLRRDVTLTSVSVRLMHMMPALDHGKAVRELGWKPAPTEEGIQAAARWFAAQGASAGA
jgi:dihydroflavonol-4-reductase